MPFRPRSAFWRTKALENRGCDERETAPEATSSCLRLIGPASTSWMRAAHSLFAPRAQRRDNSLIGQASPKSIERDSEMAGIHTDTPENSTRFESTEGILESRLYSESFNGHIHTAPASLGANCADRIFGSKTACT